MFFSLPLQLKIAKIGGTRCETIKQALYSRSLALSLQLKTTQTEIIAVSVARKMLANYSQHYSKEKRFPTLPVCYITTLEC